MIKVVTKADASKAMVLTHNGIFHADEVMATAILDFRNNYMESEENASHFLHDGGTLVVCRSDEVPNDFEGIVYDIGGGEFDHHQRGGNGKRDNGVPYASAGLIWREFGHHICEWMLLADMGNDAMKMSSYEHEMLSRNAWWIKDQIDRTIVQGIDAWDTGKISKVEKDDPIPMNFSQMIRMFNPAFLEDDSDECRTAAFIRAVEFAEEVLRRALLTDKGQAYGRSVAYKAIGEDAEILVLPRCVHWMSAVLDPDIDWKEEAEMLKYCIFPSLRGGWQWRAIPVSEEPFADFRNPTPDEWKGLSGKNLQRESNVDDATFCHPSGFTGGAGSFEGCLKMVETMLGRFTITDVQEPFGIDDVREYLKSTPYGGVLAVDPNEPFYPECPAYERVIVSIPHGVCNDLDVEDFEPSEYGDDSRLANHGWSWVESLEKELEGYKVLRIGKGLYKRYYEPANPKNWGIAE